MRDVALPARRNPRRPIFTRIRSPKQITSCESWGDPNKEPREFTADGQVLRGSPNPDDVALGQINLPKWGVKAKELGFDLYTYSGNLEMPNGFSTTTAQHRGSTAKGVGASSRTARRLHRDFTQMALSYDAAQVVSAAQNLLSAQGRGRP